MRGQLWWAHVDDAARPWLVMQAEVLNETAPTLLAVPVTLAEQEAGWPLTVLLAPADTGFPRPSWARITLLRALRREHLEEPIATLHPERVDEVATAIAAVLGLETTSPSHGGYGYRGVHPTGTSGGANPITKGREHASDA